MKEKIIEMFHIQEALDKNFMQYMGRAEPLKVEEVQKALFDECELNENIKSIVNVLLEEHKKIELTRFEFDMFKISENEHPQLKYLNENLYYTRLKEKGYFKNVDLNMTAEEVLENCEIVD